LSGSGIARMSGSAGVMSNQVAKPAKPAPDFATASIALAGTILARMVPNRSRKEMRKYLIRCFFAVSPNDGIVRPPVWNATPPKAGSHSFLSRNPIGTRGGNLRHRGGLEGERHEILRFEIMDMRLAAGAGDSLNLERHHRKIIGQLAARDRWIEALGERSILSRDAGWVTPLVPIVIGPSGRSELAIFVFKMRVIVPERDQRRGPDRHGIRTQRQALCHVGAITDASRHDQLDLAMHA